MNRTMECGLVNLLTTEIAERSKDIFIISFYWVKTGEGLLPLSDLSISYLVSIILSVLLNPVPVRIW